MHALDRTCLSPGLPHGITPYAGRRVVSCLLRQRRRRSIDRFINMARHITPRSNPPVVRSKEGGGNGNGSDSRPGDGEAILTAVKRNGAGSIKGPIPGISDGSGSGSGSGNGNGHGGSGNNGGSGSNNEGNSNRYNGVLFMAGVLAAAAGLYAGYQIVSALRNKNRDQLAAATSQPERPHDDIAALKRLLREVFTKQIQMDTRISALEPQQESAPTFDALVRSNNGWTRQSSAGKAKVEFSGELTTGAGLLYSQEQDQERAARSLNQAGMSTSAQLLLNARSDLGGDDSNALHAQCLVRPETGQASLHKVAWQCEPRQAWQLYLSPVGGKAADAVITLNAQAGPTLSHSLLQLTANPVSSLHCALTAARHTSASHTFSAPASSPSPQNHHPGAKTGNGSHPAHAPTSAAAAASMRDSLHGSPQAEVDSKTSEAHPGGTAWTGVGSSGERGQDGVGSSTQQQQADRLYGNGHRDRQEHPTLPQQPQASRGSWNCHGIQGPWSNPTGIQGPWSNPTAIHHSQPLQSQHDPDSSSAKSSELDLGISGVWNWAEEIAISGWMAVQPLLQPHPVSWGATLSSYPDAATDAWALSVCRSSGVSIDADKGGRCYTAELSLHKALADGITLTPALVYQHTAECGTVAFCCRTQWSF